MFYWLLGVDFNIVYWIIGVFAFFIFFILLLNLIKEWYEKYHYKISRGEVIYFHLPKKEPNYKLLKKSLFIISSFALVVILTYFFITKEKVFVYQVEDLNSFNYEELTEIIKKEFKPDDGIIYYIEHLTALRTEYTNEFNLNTIEMILFIKKNGEVFRIDVDNKKNTIIIEESRYKDKTVGDYIQNHFRNLENDGILRYYEQVDFEHIKSNMTMSENEFLMIFYEFVQYRNISNAQSYSLSTLFMVNKNGEITEIPKDTQIDANLTHSFLIIKFKKVENLKIGYIPTNSSTLRYFIE